MVLVHQYRPAVDRWLLEIPAGTCDVDGEPPEETARRELAEEVGLRRRPARAAGPHGHHPRVLRRVSPTSTWPPASVRCPSDRQGAEERFMEVVEVPLDRFDAMVDDGSIVDAPTILGVGLAVRRLAARG